MIGASVSDPSGKKKKTLAPSGHSKSMYSPFNPFWRLYTSTFFNSWGRYREHVVLTTTCSARMENEAAAFPGNLGSIDGDAKIARKCCRIAHDLILIYDPKWTLGWFRIGPNLNLLQCSITNMVNHQHSLLRHIHFHALPCLFSCTPFSDIYLFQVQANKTEIYVDGTYLNFS